TPGELYVWDWNDKGGSLFEPVRDGFYNNFIGLIEPGILVSSNYLKNGRLQSWKIPEGKTFEPQGEPRAFHAANEPLRIAQALAVVSSKPGGPPDHVAVVLLEPKKPLNRYRLQLHTLKPGGEFGKALSPVNLWDSSTQPTLAATP